MKRWAILCGVLLFSAVAASAQESPKVEAFGGYSYVHISDSSVNLSTGLNGGSGSVSFNPNNWLGVVADFGGYEGSQSGFNGTLYSYLFGPKIAFRSGRITPFAQALFGGAHASVGSSSENAFAMALGGGVDANVTSHIGVRLVQAEYFLTDLKDGGNNRQNNVRVSAGVVFRF